jgi:streptogramin lyase
MRPNQSLHKPDPLRTIVLALIWAVLPASAFAQSTAPSFTTQPADLTLPFARPGRFEPTVAGSVPMTFQWFKDGLAIASGTNLTLQIPNAVGPSEGIYALVASNAFGAVQSSNATLRVIMEPVITTQPVNVTADPGGEASFTVTGANVALGGTQWFRDGVPIPRANNTRLTIANVQAIDEGEYHAELFNLNGSTQSAKASLRLRRPATETERQPQLKSIVVASPINQGEVGIFRLTAGGDKPLSVQWLFNGQPVPGATNANWPRPALTFADAGEYAVQISNPVGSITTPAQTLVINPPVRPSNDTFTQRPQLGAQPSAQRSLGNATLEEGEPRAFPDLGGRTLWWTYSIASSGLFTLSTTGSTFRPVLSVFTGNSISNLTLVTRSVSTDRGVPTTAQFHLEANVPYQIQVDHHYPEETGDLVRLTYLLDSSISTNSPPTWVDAPPTSTNLPSGSRLTLAARAKGAPPLRYEWLKDGRVLSNATSITFSNAQPADSGAYRIRISNPFGTLESEVIQVDVAAVRPVLLSEPIDRTLTAGSPLVLSVLASGTSPFTYQWFHNGQPIPGETAPSLRRPLIVPTDSLAFHAVVSNSEGSITSRTATVRVIRPGTRYRWSTLRRQDGSVARFAGPSGIAFAPNGDFFVTEATSGLVQRVGSDGRIEPLPDRFGTPGQFGMPVDVAIHPRGSVLVLDNAGAIFQWNAGLSPISIGAQSGWALFVDAEENIWSSSLTGQLRKLPPKDNAVTTNVGGNIVDLTKDLNGDLLLADIGGSVIRRIGSGGISSVVAGVSGRRGAVDGPAETAGFNWPNSVSVDTQGNIFVSDEGASLIRRISPDRIVTTVGGSSTGSALDGVGAAARFSLPRRVVAGEDGRLYVVDTGNDLVRIGTPVVTGQRQLHARIVDSALELSWDPGDDLCILESSQILGPDAQWSPLDPIQGSEPVQRIPLALLEVHPRFYRLRVL